MQLAAFHGVMARRYTLTQDICGHMSLPVISIKHTPTPPKALDPFSVYFPKEERIYYIWGIDGFTPRFSKKIEEQAKFTKFWGVEVWVRIWWIRYRYH